jgi:hypothetical protein
MRLDPRSVAPLSAAMSPKISASKGARGAARLHRAIDSAETERVRQKMAGYGHAHSNSER